MVTELLTALWASVERTNAVYLVVENELPYLEQPEEGDEPLVSELRVFNTIEGVEDYKAFLVECMDVAPSSLKMIKLDLKDLWSLIEELSAVAMEAHGATLAIELVHSTSGGHVVASDLIYSQLDEPN